MKKIAVIGTGSAGIQSLCHFLSWIDNSWVIVSIHNKNIDILGIGESANPTLNIAIEHGLNFDIVGDLQKLDATQKFGTKFINWRNHEFVNPLISGTISIHFDTFKLKEYAFSRFKKIWNKKFEELEGNVDEVYNQNDHAVAIVDGIKHEYDYIIDCRGFPKNYDNYTIIKNPLVNRALIHNKIKSGSDWKYTHHTATKDGWMFSLPLQSRESYGYMFNDSITDTQTAKKNFSETINVPVDQLQNIEYKFKSYYCNKVIDGRIIKNGNLAVFFEPLFSNSLWLYDQINRQSYDFILKNSNLSENDYNHIISEKCREVEDVIYFHYHGGSIYKTHFWDHAREYSIKKLNESQGFKRAKEHCRNKWKLQMHDTETPWVFNTKNLFLIDSNFGYNYFTGE